MKSRDYSRNIYLLCLLSVKGHGHKYFKIQFQGTIWEISIIKDCQKLEAEVGASLEKSKVELGCIWYAWRTWFNTSEENTGKMLQVRIIIIDVDRMLGISVPSLMSCILGSRI